MNATSRLTQLLDNAWINDPKDDYSYRSGWNPAIVEGQQYMIAGAQGQALVGAIEGRYSSKEDKVAVLRELQKRSSKLGSSAAMGGVALDVDAAAYLSSYAKSLGLAVTFQSGQGRPIHPVG